MRVANGVEVGRYKGKRTYQNDLWEQYRCLCDERGLLQVRHVNSHRLDLAGVSFPWEAVIVNEAADKVADEMAERVRPSRGYKGEFDAIEAKAELILRRIVAIGRGICEKAVDVKDKRKDEKRDAKKRRAMVPKMAALRREAASGCHGSGPCAVAC